MASNPNHPFVNPPPSSSSAGEKEMASDEEGHHHHHHTIFSSEEDEPEDPPPRSSGEAQTPGRKRLSEGMISANARSKRTKETENRMGAKRLFSKKDDIVLLQGVIDYKGKNPFENKRSFYGSLKGSFSVDVTFAQFMDKIRTLKRSYVKKEIKGGEASRSNPHQEKCFRLSKLIWGPQGIAFNEKPKKSERRVSKKREDMKKSSSLVEKESDCDCDESAFFVGMDFLKEKWNKVPSSETKKETQEKMKKLHANELECQKFEEMLKVMKDKCAQEKVELLNEVTSLIMAADI